MSKIIVLMAILAVTYGSPSYSPYESLKNRLNKINSMAESPIQKSGSSDEIQSGPISADEIRSIVANEIKKAIDAPTTTAEPPTPLWMKWAGPWANGGTPSDDDAPWMYWANTFGSKSKKDGDVPGVVVVDDKTAMSVYPSQVKKSTK